MFPSSTNGQVGYLSGKKSPISAAPKARFRVQSVWILVYEIYLQRGAVRSDVCLIDIRLSSQGCSNQQSSKRWGTHLLLLLVR